jgi:hypothetical protein
MGSEDVEREVRRCEDSGDVRGVIVVLTLSRHRDDVDVQAECLRVLANMCSGNDENRRAAGRRGAIQAAVDAMTRHGGNGKVQEDGCWALMSMCHDDDENARVAGRYGAIEAVVDAMTRHGGNENVQKKGYGSFVASWLWWLRRTNKSPRRR